MHSPPRLWLHILAALALAAVAPSHAQGQGASPRGAPGDPPSEVQIRRAIESLRDDPDLSAQYTVRSLRWAAEESATSPDLDLSWLDWILGLFSWMAQTSRILVWIVVAALAALLVIYLVRLARQRRPAAVAQPEIPTHVRSMDIREESLPHDVGATAKALRDAGEYRAALALLYRGMLSRLVHQHGVPIRHSSTEGDCLALGARHLSARRQTYVTQLIQVWIHVVYGGRPPDPTVMQALCDGFAASLDSDTRVPA